MLLAYLLFRSCCIHISKFYIFDYWFFFLQIFLPFKRIVFKNNITTKYIPRRYKFLWYSSGNAKKIYFVRLKLMLRKKVNYFIFSFRRNENVLVKLHHTMAFPTFLKCMKLLLALALFEKIRLFDLKNII